MKAKINTIKSCGSRADSCQCHKYICSRMNFVQKKNGSCGRTFDLSPLNNTTYGQRHIMKLLLVQLSKNPSDTYWMCCAVTVEGLQQGSAESQVLRQGNPRARILVGMPTHSALTRSWRGERLVRCINDCAVGGGVCWSLLAHGGVPHNNSQKQDNEEPNKVLFGKCELEFTGFNESAVTVEAI